ncbi:MAG TPA: trigger factor [Opitutaceae bacterium]|nr:trigger factor [Opitutaceae bacterium]
MNIELKDLSETRKNLVVSLDKSEVEGEYQAVVGEYAKQARLPGFRPGKAPAAMILKKYAKEITDEFKNKVVNKAYRGGLEQAKLDIISIINVEQGTIEPNLSSAITFTLDVRPAITLPDYAGLPTEVQPVEPTEAEVDTVIASLRTERADFKVAARAAQKGDYVKLAYEGRVDGKPILELAPDKQIYGKVPQTWEEVEGQEGVIPGLGAQLAGVKAGDKKDVTVTFPAGFTPVAALAGKSAIYAVEIQEVRERVLPELNEEFFKSQQVDSLEALRTKVREDLKLRKGYENRTAQRRQVSDALAARANFTVPESLVEGETQNMLRQFIGENLRRGVPQESFEKDKKQLYEDAHQAATARVKVQMMLAKIAEQEKITVTEKDIDNFIYREAARSRQSPEKIIKGFTKDRDQLRAVQQSIIFDKALDFIVSKATVSTVQPKPEKTP